MLFSFFFFSFLLAILSHDTVPLDKVTHESASAENLLKDWAISHQIHHAVLKDLLNILQSQYDLNLPSDPLMLYRIASNI